MIDRKNQRVDSQIPSEQLPLSTFKVKRIKTALLLRQKKLSLLRNIFATLLLLCAVGILFAFYRSGGSFDQSVNTFEEQTDQNYSMVAVSVIPQTLERMHYYGIHSSASFSSAVGKEIKESLAGLHEKVNHFMWVTNSRTLDIDINKKLQPISDAFSETKQQWNSNSILFSQNSIELGNDFIYNATVFIRKISELLDRIKGNIMNAASQSTLFQ